ncbi:MAG: hypothetical protein UE295_08900 [Acutalibacteraceae bacterium]|nr:hypothetical protein [Acutalibacteraceae bacterium]
MDGIFGSVFFIICVFLIIIGYSRNMNDSYHAGSGMFKNSEYNLDEENKDISDVEYFNKKGKMK